MKLQTAFAKNKIPFSLPPPVSLSLAAPKKRLFGKRAPPLIYAAAFFSPFPAFDPQSPPIPIPDEIVRQKCGGGGRAIEKEEEAIPKRKRKEQVSRDTVLDMGEKSGYF